MKLEIETNKALKEVENQVVNLADKSRIKINSQPTFEIAKAQLINLKSVKKIIQEKKDGIIKPLNEALKNARELFKPFEEKLGVIERYLNAEILNYNYRLVEEQIKRQKEAMEKLEEAEKKGEEINPDKIIKKVENITQKIDQIRTRKIKKFRLVDISKVPSEYLIINEVLVRKTMMEGKEIPGIEYYEETIATNNY